MGEGAAGPGRGGDIGRRWVVALAEGLQGARGSVVVALDHLEDPLGRRQVGDRVVHAPDGVDLGVDDRPQLRRGERRRRGEVREWRQAGEVVRIGGADPGGVEVLHQRQAVDDVARLDGADGNVADVGGGPGDAVAGQREGAAQLEDEAVEEQVVAVVEAPLELVAEEGSQALAVADPLDHPHRGPDPFRRQVHRQRLRVVRCGVGEVAVAQDRRGHRVVERRGVDVAHVCGVAPQRRVTGHPEDRRQLLVELHGGPRPRLRSHVLQPPVPTDEDPPPPDEVRFVAIDVAVRIATHRRQTSPEQPATPRVEPVRTGVEVGDEPALQRRRGSAGKPVDGGQLVTEVGIEWFEYARDELPEEEVRVAGDRPIDPVEELPAASRVGFRLVDVDEPGLDADGGDLIGIAGVAARHEVDAGVDEAEVERMTHREVQQLGRRPAVVEPFLPPERVMRDPCRLGEPFEVVEAIGPVHPEASSLRQRRRLHQVAAQQVGADEEELVQDGRVQPLLGHADSQFGEDLEPALDILPGDLVGVDVEGEGRVGKSVVQLVEGLGIALVELDGRRVEADDVEQALLGVVGGHPHMGDLFRQAGPELGGGVDETLQGGEERHIPVPVTVLRDPPPHPRQG